MNGSEFDASCDCEDPLVEGGPTVRERMDGVKVGEGVLYQNPLDYFVSYQPDMD